MRIGATRQNAAEVLGGQRLFAALSRFAQRLGGFDRAHPWVLDTGLVAFLVLGPGLLESDGEEGGIEPDFSSAEISATGLLALRLGLLLPLLWRRKYPSTVFTVVSAVFFVQCLLGVWQRATLAVLIALYTLARYAPIKHVLIGAAATVATLVMSAVRLADDGDDISPDVLFYMVSTVIAAVAVGLVVRIRQAQLAGLRERAARLEIERDQRSRLAAAAERNRVAREMHDIVGHNLSVIITLADGGAHAATLGPERGRQALVLIGDTGRQALSELRRTLGVLRDDGSETAPELSPQPGIADLDALCARIRAAGPQVVYRTSGQVDGLGPGVQLAVYRIAQEALTNALKHAGPDTRVGVTVSVQGARVEILIQDTGPHLAGARPLPEPGEGHGLTGMTERAALYGGTVTAGPALGGGWTVHAILDGPAETGGTT